MACKDMSTGEQTKLDAKATISRIKTGLEARRKGAVIREHPETGDNSAQNG